jgi:hypothetical protein
LQIINLRDDRGNVPWSVSPALVRLLRDNVKVLPIEEVKPKVQEAAASLPFRRSRPAFGGSAKHCRTLNGGRNEEWARRCIAFNQAVLIYLRESEAIDLVVLSSTFDGIVNQTQFRTLFHDGFEYRVLDATKGNAVERLKATVTEIRRLGKQVVVVGPPPSGGFDIGSCLQRRLAGKVVFGVPFDCTIQLSEYQNGKAAALERVGALPDQADVVVVRLDSLLCSIKTCMTSIEGVGLYNNDIHLSVEGSLFIAERFDLLGRIEATAR